MRDYCLSLWCDFSEQWLNSAIFQNWHGPCNVSDNPGDGLRGDQKKENITVTYFSNRVVAALSSIALSAVFLAFAIAPASQNVVQSGLIA